VSELQVTEDWSQWDATGCDLSWGSERATLRIGGISLEARDRALRELKARIAQGESLAEAVESLSVSRANSTLPSGQALRDDVILVDASHLTDASAAVDVAKSVSSLARGSRRVVAVAGALNFSGDSDYDNLSAFGALMVRLNITQVFSVGQGARALFLSVGMEGSWDGESRFCQDSLSAYDDIRAHIQPGDVLLVLGSTEESLSPLVEKLKAELA
jgi:UDP-N-acetylmuramoyl-tripeptide--D-alanyl-D-alanine ligase